MLTRREILLTVIVEILVVCVATTEDRSGSERVHLTSADRILAHGYPAETHEVETPDGYLLGLFRIPYSVKLQNQQQTRPVVLFLHGFTSSSDGHLLNGPDNGLAFLLADEGYDVWLGNCRGTVYSRKHTNLTTQDRLFWHFGWHEIGTIDVAAMIDYILDKTGQKALHYVAHSQGTTIFLVLMSMRPEYNEKIKTSHLLAPVAYMAHSNDANVKGLAPILGTPGPIADEFANREYKMGSPYVRNILSNVCANGMQQPNSCTYLGIMYTNGDYENVNITAGPIYFDTHPAGGSTTQVIHFNQLYASKEFRQFDYGVHENIKRYGSQYPPNYALENITSAIYLYLSDYDVITASKDLIRLAARLPNLKRYYQVPVPKFTHLDFLIGIDVKYQINLPVIKLIKEYERERTQMCVLPLSSNYVNIFNFLCNHRPLADNFTFS